jgi:Uma2 family endonuclease
MSALVKRRLWTVEEYYEMAAAGILSENDRVELIEGEIVEMSPVGPVHAACVRRLNKLFNELFGRVALVQVQDPIRLGKRSEPLPDVALVQPRADFYTKGHPEPEDIFLLVEVAQSSLEKDQKIKIPMYARAGIAEVWLVHLMGQVVYMYRKPSPSGYQEVLSFERGDSFRPLAFVGAVVTVDMILGE